MKKITKILVIDVEATCWKDRSVLHRNEIIEIGIAVVDINTKKIESNESIIVLPPTTEISDFCTELTTLTPEYVEEHGVEYNAAMDTLIRRFKSQNHIFASWGEYDRTAFENNCHWNRAAYPFSRMHMNIKTLFAAKYGYTGGQNQCAKDIGITVEGTAHRGVWDALNGAKILTRILT